MVSLRPTGPECSSPFTTGATGKGHSTAQLKKLSCMTRDSSISAFEEGDLHPAMGLIGMFWVILLLPGLGGLPQARSQCSDSVKSAQVDRLDQCHRPRVEGQRTRLDCLETCRKPKGSRTCMVPPKSEVIDPWCVLGGYGGFMIFMEVIASLVVFMVCIGTLGDLPGNDTLEEKNIRLAYHWLEVSRLKCFVE